MPGPLLWIQAYRYIRKHRGRNADEMKMLESSLRRKTRQLLDRLERISADSPWAHQASGVRASLSKHLASEKISRTDIEDLLLLGYQILENAAKEIPENRIED